MQLDGGRFDRMLQSANALGLVVVRGEVVGNGWTSVGALRPLAVAFVGAAGAVVALRRVGALAGSGHRWVRWYMGTLLFEEVVRRIG